MKSLILWTTVLVLALSHLAIASTGFIHHFSTKKRLGWHTTSRANSSLTWLNSQTQIPTKRAAVSDTTDECNEQDFLTCRVLGFYPFPTPPPKGPIGWLLRDAHQAIIITSSALPKKRILLDFMTEGGEFHPVWYNERVKWNVFLGGNIRGEVRVRYIGGEEEIDRSPKLEQLLRIARSYDCNMNLYTNNCRIFCAKMEREVEVLNRKDRQHTSLEKIQNENNNYLSTTSVDIRYVMRIVGAGLLPFIYPLSALWLSYEGLRDVF